MRIGVFVALAWLGAGCAGTDPESPPAPPPGPPGPAAPLAPAEPAGPAGPAAPATPVAPAAPEAPVAPAAPAALPPTPVEWARRLPPPEPGILATGPYRTGEGEGPFLERLSEEERAPGSAFRDYSITGKTGTSVGWLGIVRGVREDPAKGVTRLLVEHKYFDGLQDTHILCTSFNGGGDFVVTLRGTGHEVRVLAMVRVYGKVAAEREGVPRVEAEFVRVFEWGLFTFISAYGKQKGNEAWRARNTLDPERIYRPVPGPSYYAACLGDREEAEAAAVEVPE